MPSTRPCQGCCPRDVPPCCSHHTGTSCSMELGLLLLGAHETLHKHTSTDQPKQHLQNGWSNTATRIYSTARLVLIDNFHCFNK